MRKAKLILHRGDYCTELLHTNQLISIPFFSLDLFHRSIVMSGSSAAGWAVHTHGTPMWSIENMISYLRYRTLHYSHLQYPSDVSERLVKKMRMKLWEKNSVRKKLEGNIVITKRRKSPVYHLI